MDSEVTKGIGMASEKEITLDLCGTQLTVSTLEMLLDLLNKHKTVLVKNAGRSSSMELAVDLLARLEMEEVWAKRK